MKNSLMLLIITFLWATALIACKKKTAFMPGSCYSVSQLLNAKEAKVACDEKASFEGTTLCLTGLLEVSNDPRPMPHNFFLLNTTDSNMAVEVQLEGEIAAIVIPQVQANRGESAKVIGTITGFGHPGNPDCKRSFILRLANAADFRME